MVRQPLRALSEAPHMTEPMAPRPAWRLGEVSVFGMTFGWLINAQNIMLIFYIYIYIPLYIYIHLLYITARLIYIYIYIYTCEYGYRSMEGWMDGEIDVGFLASIPISMVQNE